jgi:chromosome segregation ATPase
MIVQNPNQQRKPYEDKIKELQRDLQVASRELGFSNQALESSRHEKIRLDEDMLRIKDSIKKEEAKLEKIVALIERKKKDHKDVVEGKSAAISSARYKIAELVALKKSLSIDIKDLVKMNKELDILKKKIVQSESHVSYLEKKKDDLEKFMLRFRDEIKKEESRIATEKSYVEDLMRKNGKMLTDTNNNLYLIQIYARRLQRYYNYNGIKINILEKFKVTPDEKNI